MLAPAGRGNLGRFVPLAVALLGSCLAAAASLWLQHQNDAQIHADFERSATRVAQIIEVRMQQPIFGLRGAGGVYAASKQVRRSEFRAYVESRDLAQEFPGVRGFGFIQRLERSALPAFVAAEQADEAPQFAVRELWALGEEDLYVIKYIEPAVSNAAALGLDIGSEPIRREAAERAVATGLPTLTAAITLVQDTRRSAGFLLFVPVFRNGTDPTTPAQRRQALVGLLFAPMVVGEILAAVPDVAAGLAHFQLIDATIGNTVFDSGDDTSSGLRGTDVAPRLGRFQEDRKLSLPGRDMLLRVRSTPQFDAAHSNAAPWLLLAGGLLTSVLLAGLLRQQINGRGRAEALARAMTVDLQRLAAVARRTSNAVVITDARRRITWVNEGFERISGYSAAEALGQSPGALLQDAGTDAATVAALRTALNACESFQGEILNRAKDGRRYWLALDIQPLYDDDGSHQGFMAVESDITERRAADAALRASQALLDKTGRIAGVGGWAVELESQVIRWSDQTCRIHDREPGHQPGMEEAINYYAPEARAEVAQAVQRCIERGESFDIELPMVTAQGRSIWVRSVGELESADGRPLRLVGTFQDVTERHQLEDEVRRKSELLTSVIENLPCGLSVFDGELQLVASNTEFRRLLDFPDALFAGASTHFEEVIRFNAGRGEYGPGDVEATVQAIVARARQSTEPHQFERVRPDGTQLEIRGGPMPGGGFVTTYTDISARKRAEAEVQRASALLRGSIDALEDAYALFDADGILVLCNQPYRDLYPLCAELMVPGARFEDIVRAGAERGQYADAIGRVDAWVAERVATHRQPSSKVTRRLGDGRILRIGERRMADGHIVGFHVDITEFVRATEAAQEASRSKSQFLANMSHEIRTPMNAILGMLALLKKTELTARQADYTGKTEGAARSLLGLLNDILDFSKVEAGKMTLDLHPFRPDQLLRDLAVILASNTAGKQIEVLFDIDPQLPPVLVGDAMRLQQVLINLGGNAIKFTAHGEVVVSVAVVARGSDSVTLEVAVRDSGIGIAPENQQHIFSGFSQAEASTTRRFGGTGLGLAICQRLVGLMGGELQLDSAVGRGSRFYFRAELAVGSDAAGAELAPLRLRQPVALRVLVVDDNPLARELMGRLAESLGWQVTLADSGEAALACLEDAAAAFDAAFIDWQMPGLDGWQTCQQIRGRCKAGAKPLLIMVTAHGRDMLSQRSQEEQALVHGFLVKPVTASMLYDAVVDARSDPEALQASRSASSPAVQRLPGLRLLVVEDNANNQQVARELLEDEGALVQIADNGLLAVEAVAAADPPFDVVLMDLQMPVMDGYTATTRIRQDLQKLTLPIVAMTANAMATDREACLAAGMNDHVGKPFDLDHLVAVLLRLAGRAAVAIAARPDQAAVPTLPAEVLDAAGSAGVDIERALARLGGKLKVFGRTLRSFTADLQGLPEKLDRLSQCGERDEVRRELHTLKGVAATVGVTALAKLAGEAEAQFTSLSLPAEDAACISRVGVAIQTAESSLALLYVTLDGIPQTAKDVSSSAPAAALTPSDTALLAELLKTVQSLLQASDLDAANALQTLRIRLPAVAGVRFDALEAAVESLEFESALSLCGEWMLECEK
ncbi:PAS-domain containing protein [Rubrivivax rivuli]|uniref:Sensory/regulatory protein RpfC n=1 Tax=Rubrivivax rivuli TaxID=1862385 RepID=A0A437RGQ9_9BURK|nr:PAS-domain containing protein [Rubrivivax rivuli]RVU45956.1 response regulator [Rubrivivax rivuli]